MARRRFVAGNWKMNTNRASAAALAAAVAGGVGADAGLDVAVFPPFCYLETAAGKLAGSAVKYGGQNMYHQADGAFTGEISAAMLRDLGCTYVLLGHSERRHVMHENDVEINAKVHAALAAGLTPVVCVGELLAERELGKTTDVVGMQFAGSLAGVAPEQMTNVVLAYEPVWAIGTGKVATPEQAQAVHRDLRIILQSRYNDALAQQTRILYGGSVKASNAAELLGQADVDGLLVGGASLKAEDFLGIIKAGK